MIELTVVLTDDQVAQIAEGAATVLAERVPAVAAAERLLTVDELAQMLAVAPEWVRRHQNELGAFRLSRGGGRNPIRFRPADVERFLSERRLKLPREESITHWRDDPNWALE